MQQHPITKHAESILDLSCTLRIAVLMNWFSLLMVECEEMHCKRISGVLLLVKYLAIISERFSQIQGYDVGARDTAKGTRC